MKNLSVELKKILQICTSEELISKLLIFKELQLNSRIKKKCLISKWTEDLNRHFFPQKHPFGQQVHEKVHNIIGYHQVNVNHTIRYHLTELLLSKRQEIAKLVIMWRREKVSTQFQECKLSILWKSFEVPEKLKTEVLYDLAIFLLSIYLKEMKILT